MSTLSSVVVAPSGTGCGTLADHMAPRGSVGRWVVKSVAPTVCKDVLLPVGFLAVILGAIYLTSKHVTAPMGHKIVDVINPGHEHTRDPSLEAAVQTGLESALAVATVGAGLFLVASPVLCLSSYYEWKKKAGEASIESPDATGESMDGALKRLEEKTFSQFLIEKEALKTVLGAAGVLSAVALTFFVGHKIVMLNNEASHLRLHEQKPLAYVVDGVAGTLIGTAVSMAGLLCCMGGLAARELAKEGASHYQRWRDLDLSLSEKEAGRAT